VTVDSTGSEAPRVVLYDSAGVIAGTSGVLVYVIDDSSGAREYVAVVAPWPAVLISSTPFAVAVSSGSAAQITWYSPREVEIFGLQGASADTYVAAIRLTGPPYPSAPSSNAAIGSAELAAGLDTSRDLRQTLGSKSVFKPLLESGPAVASTASARGIAAPATALSMQPLQPTVSDVQSVTDGLCRIFHWD
jgi:hypothetical protein